jgi:uncharacterized membrane protein
MSGQSKNSKPYKTGAALFTISGLIFIVVGIVSLIIGGVPVFLSIGIALVVISMVLWQRYRKMIHNSEEKTEK